MGWFQGVDCQTPKVLRTGVEQMVPNAPSQEYRLSRTEKVRLERSSRPPCGPVSYLMVGSQADGLQRTGGLPCGRALRLPGRLLSGNGTLQLGGGGGGV